jgi:transcriptional regulator with XRE-family HTH domain
MKDRRKQLGISQERLAELTGLSVQTINFIEGCRTWVSDKTLIKLADALKVEVFQLVGPAIAGGHGADTQLLGTLKQYIKSDIDGRFEDFIRLSQPLNYAT